MGLKRLSKTSAEKPPETADIITQMAQEGKDTMENMSQSAEAK